MLYVAVAVSSWLCGFVPFLLIAWLAKRRLVARLTAKSGLLSVCRDLENRRLATESGREYLVRARAGSPARIRDGLGQERLGRLAKHNATNS